MGVDDSPVSEARPAEFVTALRTSHVIAGVVIGFFCEGLAPWTRLPPTLTGQALELETPGIDKNDLLRLASQQHVVCARPLPHCDLAAGSRMGVASAVPAEGVLTARACAAILTTLSLYICAKETTALWAYLHARVGPHRGPQIELVVLGFQETTSNQRIDLLAARHVEASRELARSDLSASAAACTLDATGMHSAEGLQD